MKYLQFAALCWKAYNGDYRAALEVLGILKDRAGVAIVRVSNTNIVLLPTPVKPAERIEGP